jgi:calmodulin-lysine N-methyltransferase
MENQFKDQINYEVLRESSIPESKELIDVSDVEKCGNSSMKSMARLRWNILCSSLRKNWSTDARSEPQLGSKRQFSTYGLIHITHKPIDNNCNNNSSMVSSTNAMSSTLPQIISDKSVDNELKSVDNELKSVDNELKSVDNELKGEWFECRFCDDTSEDSVIEIRFLTQKITINELFDGFDNTGNVCLWPSEEVLAYYCFKNRDLCSDKTVCELGGGMTCLSGLVAAVFTSAKEVILTDGNERCISNVKTIVERNAHRFSKSIVRCEQLEWGNDSHINHFLNKIDVIFCSDCLYFDDSHHLLVDTIFKLLNNCGIAIILAPTRGSSLQNFVDIAKQKFETKQITIYDEKVWQMHNHFLNTFKQSHYVTDSHFPLMITLRKPYVYH